MPDAVTHPTKQELAAFGLGKLPDRAAAAVAAHLESCPACRQAVAGVSTDSFLRKVRDAGKGGSSSPPNSARADNAPSSAGQPAIPVVPYPDVPPDLARHPKYLILRELGRGGMGVVYQARHREMDRQVVIKVINRALLDRPDSLERFRREIRAAAQLSHPNIVTAYDAEEAGDAHMLVMEFVPGQSLAEVVKKKGRLPVGYACHFTRQVALGLQHAFERKMVHRDIKPQNLMLSLKNQVKILDFGLAKMLREEGTSTGLTSHNTFMGTPDYCAPEQSTDARTADIRADLYSLGCTLYCLLAGRPPFREDTVVKTILAHLQKEPQPLPELRPDVPVELWQVVARLLSKEPAQRYQTPIEVAQALVPFIKSGTTQEAKAGSSPPPSVKSPVKGTVIEADTNEVKQILRLVPGKAPPQEAPATDEASPFENLVDTSPPLRKSRESTNRVRARWYRRWPVLAGIGVLLLTLLGVLASGLFKLTVKTSDGILVLENLPDDAEVLLDGGRANVKWDKGRRTAEISAPPGRHKIEAKIGDVMVIGEDVELHSGERRPPIRARFVRSAPAPQETGFVSLFDGKSLNGWKKHLKQPGDWKVKNGFLTCSGATSSYLYSERGDYKDFRLRVEARINEKGSGGVYFRAPFGPQIPEHNATYPIGYEALINNRNISGTGSLLNGGEGTTFSDHQVPIPPDQWFWMEVIAEGNHITVKVNDQTTVDYTDEKRRFTSGHIVFEQFLAASVIEFRTIKIKELPAVNAPAAAPPGAAAEDKGFVQLFNGKDLTGWKVANGGNMAVWGADNSVLYTSGRGGWLMTDKEYRNFELHLEFKLSQASNSGVALRSPMTGDPAYVGMEIQLLDDAWYKEKNKDAIAGTQLTGAIYDLKPPSREALKPIGEWNTLRIVANRRRVTVELNEVKITDADLDEHKDKAHRFPGLLRDKGNVGLQSHIGRVEFRNIEIKELK